MRANICDKCRSRVATKTVEGKDWCSICWAQEQRHQKMTSVYQAAKSGIESFRKVWNQYGDSGVCDSEGRYALSHWLTKSLQGEKKPRITFSYLEGYSTYEGSKREIASAISKAAADLVKVLKKAARDNGLNPSEHAEDIVYNCFG
jgi:hypothetical protein